MRLIDAEVLQRDFEKDIQRAVCVSQMASIICIQSMVDKQPTAYDVDKVVEQLEERKNTLMTEFVLADKDIGVKLNALGKINEIGRIIKIVKSGGIE